MKIDVGKVPGPKSKKLLEKNKKINGGWSLPFPAVYSEGKGCYFKDVDGNVFLDFSSQVATKPLGYSHPALNKILKKYDETPVKLAGQDFLAKEHIELIEELADITPTGFDSAFLVNSGAEAVENALKVSMSGEAVTYGVSFKNAFHGRTLGALSFTSSKPVHKKGFWSFPARNIPFDESAPQALKETIKEEGKDPCFVIAEVIQGEGGYNLPPKEMFKEIREITKERGIPLIFDEVQCGMGRTGEWWGFQNYDVKPEVFSSAKALQVGATIAPRNAFPEEPGALSSTWGGGSLIDMALGKEIIKTIKKEKLLSNCKKMGEYIVKRLKELSEKHPHVLNPRGRGLMCAFDLTNKDVRDHLADHLAREGLIVLGAGQKTIRIIPPYIVSKEEIDEAMQLINESLKDIHREVSPKSSHAEHTI